MKKQKTTVQEEAATTSCVIFFREQLRKYKNKPMPLHVVFRSPPVVPMSPSFLATSHTPFSTFPEAAVGSGEAPVAPASSAFCTTASATSSPRSSSPMLSLTSSPGISSSESSTVEVMRLHRRLITWTRWLFRRCRQHPRNVPASFTLEGGREGSKPSEERRVFKAFAAGWGYWAARQTAEWVSRVTPSCEGR